MRGSIRSSFIALAIALAVAACGKDDDQGSTPSAGEADEILADIAEHRDKVCGCPDKDCALAAGEEAAKFEDGVRARFKNPTPEQREKFAEITAELKECLRR
jgi:hypothetical protein